MTTRGFTASFNIREEIATGSYTNTSFPNIYKYLFRGFIEMYFKMTDILFSV